MPSSQDSSPPDGGTHEQELYEALSTGESASASEPLQKPAPKPPPRVRIILRRGQEEERTVHSVSLADASDAAVTADVRIVRAAGMSGEGKIVRETWVHLPDGPIRVEASLERWEELTTTGGEVTGSAGRATPYGIIAKLTREKWHDAAAIHASHAEEQVQQEATKTIEGIVAAAGRDITAEDLQYLAFDMTNAIASHIERAYHDALQLGISEPGQP